MLVVTISKPFPIVLEETLAMCIAGLLDKCMTGLLKKRKFLSSDMNFFSLI
jgi:hypothetical protein